MLRGIDLDELAARTRIPRRSLERLEAGAFDQTPDGFSRGFVRTVAEAIGLNPDEAVARMRAEPDAGRNVSAPRIGRVFAAIAGLALLAVIGLGMREWAFAPPQPHATTGALPVRRDYVRALAAARGIAVARISSRDAVLPAQPLQGEAPEALVEAEAVAVAAAATVTPPRVTEPPPRIEVEATPALATSAVSPPATSEPTTGEPRVAAPLSEARATQAAHEPTPEPAPAAAPSPDAENRD